MPYTPKSGTCPLNPRDETAYHRWGFRDSVDLIIMRYRRYSGCQTEPVHFNFPSPPRAEQAFGFGSAKRTRYRTGSASYLSVFLMELEAVVLLYFLAFPTFVYRSMRCHPIRMSSSLDECCSEKFLVSSSGASNLWVEDMCTCWLVYLFLRLSWFWAFGLPPLAFLILAQSNV